MKLKNYTSGIPSEKSISAIEKKLVSIGAKNINKEYSGGVLIGIKFLIDVNDTTIAFELPAKVDKVFDVLWSEIKRPHAGTRKMIEEQAERTAWKIISEWVDIQASMIYLEQAEVAQVFMPYMLSNKTGESFYKIFMNNGMKMLSA